LKLKEYPVNKLSLNFKDIEEDFNPLMEKMADFTQRSQEEKDHIAQLHNTINKLREKVHDYEEREKEHKKDLVLKTQAMIQIKKVVEAETIQFVEQSRQLAERIEEVKELKQRCESYQLEAEELRSAIGSLQKDTSGMERVIESQLEQDLNSMQFELDEKSEKVAKLTSQISELHEEIEYLKSENNREKTRADNLELSKEALIGKIEALDSLNLEEKTKIGILETELENLQKKINDKDLMCNNKAETIDKHHQTSPSKSLEEKSVSDEVQAKLASLASDK
jgi:chromosome segregation ATPase